MSKYKTMAYMTVIAMLEILLVFSLTVYHQRSSKKSLVGINKGSEIELNKSDKKNSESKEKKDSNNIAKVKDKVNKKKTEKDIEIVDEEVPMSDVPLDIMSLEDLFEKALIIGDSRITSMYYRLHCDTGTFAFDAAVSSKNLKDKKLSSNKKIKENAYSIVDVNKNKYKKIYLSVGLNDVGNISIVDYYKNMKRYVSYVKKQQPKCKVYICSIIYMSEDKAGKDNDINKKIDKYNKQLKQIAIETDSKYIDMNSKMKNSNKAIKKRYTIDGINLNTDGCSMMSKILLNNQ